MEGKVMDVGHLHTKYPLAPSAYTCSISCEVNGVGLVQEGHRYILHTSALPFVYPTPVIDRVEALNPAIPQTTNSNETCINLVLVRQCLLHPVDASSCNLPHNANSEKQSCKRRKRDVRIVKLICLPSPSPSPMMYPISILHSNEQ